MHQGDGVARKHGSDRGHQSLELHFTRHGVGEIDGNLPEGAINGFLETHEVEKVEKQEEKNTEYIEARAGKTEPAPFRPVRMFGENPIASDNP